MHRNFSQIALATANNGKRREFEECLQPLGIRLYGGAYLSYPPETGREYQENALAKAQYAAKNLGLPCVAEDSGLEVAALNGLPGLYSARFAGIDRSRLLTMIEGRSDRDTPPPSVRDITGDTDAANNRLLLQLLGSSTAHARRARYVCSLVLVNRDGMLLYHTETSVSGNILPEPRGEGGFGYDPLMQFYDYPGRSVAELTPAEKNAVSHRGQAIRNLTVWLARNTR